MTSKRTVPTTILAKLHTFKLKLTKARKNLSNLSKVAKSMAGFKIKKRAELGKSLFWNMTRNQFKICRTKKEKNMRHCKMTMRREKKPIGTSSLRDPTMNFSGRSRSKTSVARTREDHLS